MKKLHKILFAAFFMAGLIGFTTVGLSQTEESFKQSAAPYTLTPDKRPDLKRLDVFSKREETIELPGSDDDFVRKIAHWGNLKGWVFLGKGPPVVAATVTLLGADDEIVLYRWRALKEGASGDDVHDWNFYVAFSDGPIYQESLSVPAPFSIDVLLVEEGNNKIQVTLTANDENGRQVTVVKTFVVKGIP